MEDDVAIKVDHVSKTFKLPHDKQNSLKGGLISLVSNGKRTYEAQEVLKDVSFKIKKGEFFGIVGRNGSGKSTLLKMLAGIYTPTEGQIHINGSLTPFIELGVGFNPELTGRENVFLNGALLGFNRKQMSEMYDDIVEFAELERFMDQKLKNYSSGMQVRLAFSIAIKAQGDVLLLDEVLAVGDEAFQRKCYSYFAQLKRERKTVVLVTHDMGSVQRFCSRAMLINDGEISVIGKTSEVTQEYQKLNEPPDKEVSNASVSQKPDKTLGNIQTKITNADKAETDYFGKNTKVIRFVNTIIPNEDVKDAFFGFIIAKETGEPVYWFTTEGDKQKIETFYKHKPTTVELTIQNVFGDGKYTINASLKSNDRTKEYIIANDCAEFTVGGHGKFGWMLRPDIEYKKV